MFLSQSVPMSGHAGHERIIWGSFDAVANCGLLPNRFRQSEIRFFPFIRGVSLRLLRIRCGPKLRVQMSPKSQGLPGRKFARRMGPLVRIAMHYRGFRRRLIRWLTAAALTTVGHRGTSPVTLPSHFPEAKTPTTLAFDRRLTVFAACRRSFKDAGPPCFTESRWLALRRGRIVFPPQVLLPGSFATTF